MLLVLRMGPGRPEPGNSAHAFPLPSWILHVNARADFGKYWWAGRPPTARVPARRPHPHTLVPAPGTWYDQTRARKRVHLSREVGKEVGTHLYASASA